MLHRITNLPFRQALAAIALVCIGILPLSGCIYSPRDLANELAPEFPLADGTYLDEKGAELHVEKVDQLYRVTDPDDEIYEIAFFRIPDYEGYVVRLNPERFGTPAHANPEAFAYGFASKTDSSMAFYVLEKNAALPPEVAALVERKPSDDSGFGVRDEKDTLRVLGQAAKGARLKHLMTLTSRP